MSATIVGQTAAELNRVADSYGIELEFWDARGEHRRATPETLKSLLAAMGAGAAELKQSRSLPPAIVVSAEDGRCQIRLPDDAPGEVDWHLRLEDGSEKTGKGRLTRAVGRPQTCPFLILERVPWGYHRLRISPLQADTALIVTPSRCWLPEGLAAEPGGWGLTVQLYLVRSDQNWGIGDFADLEKLIRISAPHGVDVIGLNPLHQLMLDDPEHASPYSPLSRLHLNALYISVPDVPGFGVCAELQDLLESSDFAARLATCRASGLVDYTAVKALKMEALRILFDKLDRTGDANARFQKFREERGEDLRRTSVFQILREHLRKKDPAWADWHAWPTDMRDPSSPAVKDFERDHITEILFLEWLQWIADEQLASVARTASESGMAIGLYRDLAIGCDRSGAETWSNPSAFLGTAQIGAPPDIFNPAGQNWGLPPLNPIDLASAEYRAFVDLIRANMRYAGGLRIDHVMGLQHLYCIPDGLKASDGAYVRYPLDELIGILALESHRHECLVIGEDLGTVPAGFRERLAAANVLSYRVLFFEQDWDKNEFHPPHAYPAHALAVAGSHDLPTLQGWWKGRDLDVKESLGLFPQEGEAGAQRERRERDRAAIVKALQVEGVLASDRPVTTERFAAAIHGFLANTRCGLVAVQLDDLIEEVEQVNVPGTNREHPNWRRKYRLTLEDIMASDNVWRTLGDLPERRPFRQHSSP
jgi:4-alpha-glucanotransferase